MKNIIKSQLSEADRSNINGLLTNLEEVLSGKTGVLSVEERAKYGSINEQNKLVVNKAREYRTTQPSLSAPDVDWTEFENDYQARLFLESCINRLNSLLHKLESTKIMHDYDNFQDALNDYSYSQYKNGAGEDDFAAKITAFKSFFAKSGKTKTPENPEDGEKT